MYSASEKIIDDNIAYFLERVNYVKEDTAHHLGSQASFAAFNPCNKEYYEYRRYEKMLEWYIREHLVNKTFSDLLNLYGVKNAGFNFEAKRGYSCFSNESIENIFKLEFKCKQDGRVIGYRYTSVCMDDDELENLFRKEHIDLIAVIDWTILDENKSNKRLYGTSDKWSKKIKNITLRQFFKKYFTEEEYKLFVEKATSAVKQANDIIGFQTIPKLSLRFLSEFKVDVYRELSQLDYCSMRYQVIENAHEDEKEKNKALKKANKIIEDEDLKAIYNNFVKNNLFAALVGREEFAKCFVTSEYMYHILNGGGAFDYTSIVCGYLKSVEQLAKKLLDLTMKNYPNEKLWIQKNKTNPKNSNDVRENPEIKKKNKNRRAPLQVLVKEENRDCFNITMAPLMWFLHDNIDGWNVSSDAREIIHGYLENYTQECRNEHFHKDNIYDWDSVQKIRDNTIFIMFLLIGGYKISEADKESFNDIGASDMDYVMLYKALKKIPSSVKNFYIQFPGKEKEKVVRLYNQAAPKYSEDGFLDESVIEFVKVEDYRIEDYEDFISNIKDEDRRTVSVNSVPEKIWYVKYGGEEVLMEYK